MHSNYQEDGVRLGGQLLDTQEAAAIVKEIRKRVKNPAVAEELEAFLARGHDHGQELTPQTRDLLTVITAGILMQRPGRSP